jgi:hypothetical protein
MADRTTQVGLDNTSDVPINPATDETLQAVAGLVTAHYDNLAITENSDNDVIVYKHGVTTVATVTVVYTSSAKTSISTITKT